MILIGLFDSPFVRRVAISAMRLGIEFEHRKWSVGKDFERIREYNPLGRVPTLVLDDGAALMESGAILDWLDEQAGPARALLPPSSVPRRESLRLMAMATGAADKGVLQIYEKAFRPAEKWHEPWLARCRSQTEAALDALERVAATRGGDRWLVSDALGQADITVACVYTFLTDVLTLDTARRPALTALTARAEALPEFRATRTAFLTPQTGS
jgi:glutathione S-transferase